MMSREEHGELREVVAVFDTPETLQEAIDDLLTSGFDQADLSLLATVETVDERLGHSFDAVAELADSATTPRAAYVSTDSIGVAQGALVGVLAYIGALAAAAAAIAAGGAMPLAIAGAALGGGGGAFLGVYLAHRLSQHHDRYLGDQLKRGGLLLWVRAWEDKREQQASEILARHAGRNVHAHVFGAAA